MKKFVSAALVTAMIASMGVSAMADVSFGSGASSDVAWPTDFGFGEKLTVINSRSTASQYAAGEKITLNPGDVIYMPLTHSAAVVEEETPVVPETPEVETPEVETPETETPETQEPAVPAQAAEAATTTAPYSGKVDKDWKIKFSARNYVENASFYKATANDKDLVKDALYIKVEMNESLDSVESKDLNYGVYISDSGSRNKTERVSVIADFENINGGEVSFDFINHVGLPSVWEVKEEKSGNAIFDFAGEAFFDVNMYDGEKVLLDMNRDYDRDIAITNEDADLEFYNFRGTHDEFIRKGTLSLYGEEDSYVYEIVDGKLYEVKAKYNDEEETLEIVTDELGHYVVSDMELKAGESKPVTPSKPSTGTSDKENPETGAGDMVGTAAALAVVSVAAAGALALSNKK